MYALYTWDHVLGKPWNPEEPEYGEPGKSGDPGCPGQNTSAACLVSGRLVRLKEARRNRTTQSKKDRCPKEEELARRLVSAVLIALDRRAPVRPRRRAVRQRRRRRPYESIPDWGQLGTPPNPCGDPNKPAGTAPSPTSESQGGALRAQNLKLLNGAILRVDPDTGDAFPGNPLEGSGDENAERTVAKGFRNPFRFTFDPTSGEIYAANVGSSEIEEIDRFQAPPTMLYNSGWPCYEGIQRQFQFKELGLNVCKALYDDPNSTSLPFFTYSHKQAVVPEDECPTDSGSAISGLSFYEGGEFPAEYKGALFFADAVRRLRLGDVPRRRRQARPATTERFLREGQIYPGVKIAEGPDGYLYYADLLSEEGSSTARSIASPTPATDAAYRTSESGTALWPLRRRRRIRTDLDAECFQDPDGKPAHLRMGPRRRRHLRSEGREKTLTFTEAEQESREAEDLSPNRVIAVRVKDDEGFTSTSRVTVYPGDKPPAVTITKPTASFRWGVGDDIKLEAKAIDAEGHEINTPLPYYWVTRLAHCPDPAHPTACHVHPLQTFAGIRSPEFTAPQHDYPSYIEAVLRVADKRELSGTATAQNRPADGRPLARFRPARDSAAGCLHGSRRALLRAADRRLRNPRSRRRRRRRSAAGPTASPAGRTGALAPTRSTSARRRPSSPPPSPRLPSHHHRHRHHRHRLLPNRPSPPCSSTRRRAPDRPRPGSSSAPRCALGPPDPGSEAVLWSGCDQVSGSGECEVEVDAARGVTATFTLEQHQIPAPEMPRPPMPAATISAHPPKRARAPLPASRSSPAKQATLRLQARLKAAACRSPTPSIT